MNAANDVIIITLIIVMYTPDLLLLWSESIEYSTILFVSYHNIAVSITFW